MLVIRFFGTPAISHTDQALTALTRSRILISLFAFLVMHRERPHARSVLAALFWPDIPEAHARRYLNTHLWRLRSILEQGHLSPAVYLLSDDETIQFSPRAPFWLDVAEFEAATQSVGQNTMWSHEAAQRLESAVALYRADFLEGIYDEWPLAHRERLRERYLLALETLVRAYRASERYTAALRAAQQLARVEPFAEEAHYQVVQLYTLLGKTHEARVHFKRYETIWRDELGLTPSARMVALSDECELGRPSGLELEAMPELPLLNQIKQVLAEQVETGCPGEEQTLRVELHRQVFTYASRIAQSLKARHANAEAESYFTLALEALAHQPESAERQQHELAVRRELDEFYDWNAEREKQAQNLQRANQLAEQLGDLNAQAEMLARRAWMEMRHGQHEIAIGNLKRAVEIGTLSDRRQEALAYRLLGIVHDELADLKTALQYHTQALRLDEATDCVDSLPNDLNNLASVEVTLGDYSAALIKLERALTLTSHQSASLTRVMIVGNIGNLWTKLGQFVAAADCLREAMQLVRQTGDRETECWLGARLAMLYQRRGESERALQMAHHYFQVAQAAEFPRRMAELAELLAAVYSVQGDGSHALHWAAQASEVASAHGFWRYELRSAMRRAQAHILLKRPAEAFDWAQRAVTTFEQKGQPLEEEPELFYTYAQSAQLMEQNTVAASAYHHARMSLLKQADLIADTRLREGFLIHHPLSSIAKIAKR